MTAQQPPGYREIAANYAEQIRSGAISPGARLPSAEQIGKEWRVSRTTGERALTVLVSEGLVETSRQGTVVRRIPVIRRRAVTRYRREARETEGGRGAFDTEIRGLGLIPRSDVEVDRVTAPDQVAEILGTDDVIVRARKMYASDVPVQMAPSYIPADIAAGTQLEQTDSGPGGMLSRLAELGHAEVRMTESVRVRRPRPDEKAWLQLPTGAAVTEIFHTGYDDGGRAVEVCVHVVAASEWVLDYAWDVD